MEKVHKEGFDGVSYTVASKTGTSTQAVSGGEVNNAVFIAFAPIEKPTLAVAVVVPEGGFGAWGAAPIARKIFDAYDQYIGLNGVPKGAPAASAPAKGQ
jgi:penicillin-binding protein 2